MKKPSSYGTVSQFTQRQEDDKRETQTPDTDLTTSMPRGTRMKTARGNRPAAFRNKMPKPRKY